MDVHNEVCEKTTKQSDNNMLENKSIVKEQQISVGGKSSESQSLKAIALEKVVKIIQGKSGEKLKQVTTKSSKIITCTLCSHQSNSDISIQRHCRLKHLSGINRAR